MTFDLYKEIPFKGFSSWFTELAALAQKSEDSSNLPRLELLLRNGHIIRGVVLKLQASGHEQQLMLLVESDIHSAGDLLFLSAHEVIGLRITHGEKFLKYFTTSAAPRETGALELKRAGKAIETALETCFSHKVTLHLQADALNDTKRGDVLNLIELLPSLFESLTADEFGKKMVNEQISDIEIHVAETVLTTLKDQKLTIQITSPASQSAAAEKKRLKSEIEALL